MSIKTFKRHYVDYWEAKEVAMYATGFALIVFAIIAAATTQAIGTTVAELCWALAVTVGLILLVNLLYGGGVTYAAAVTAIMAGTILWALLFGGPIWVAVASVVLGLAVAYLLVVAWETLTKSRDDGGSEEFL